MIIHKRNIWLLALIFSVSNTLALNLSYGLSSRQGKRPAMEDEHVHIISPKNGLFALFDGHGGDQAAKLAAKNLSAIFAAALSKNTNDVEESLRATFLELDKLILPKTSSGTVAVAAYIHNNDEATIAWAGDSRALIIKKPASDKPELLASTLDHKPAPTSPQEITRLKSALGADFIKHVAQKGKIWRIEGLAVSRSLGDKKYKDKLKNANALIPDPEIIESYLHDGYIIVLACDGLWDVFSNNDVMNMIQKMLQATQNETNQAALIEKLKNAGFDENNVLGTEKVTESEQGPNGMRLQLIARALRNAAYNNKSGDNISVMLIEYHGTNPKVGLGASSKRVPTKTAAVKIRS